MNAQPGIGGQAIVADPSYIFRHRRPRLRALFRGANRPEEVCEPEPLNVASRCVEQYGAEPTPPMIRNDACLDQRDRRGLLIAFMVAESLFENSVPSPDRQLVIASAPGERHAVDLADDRTLIVKGKQLILRKRIGKPAIEQPADRILL